MTPTARPASGATSMAAAALITSAVSTLCTSSSRSVPASVTTTSAACPAKRAALSSSASQAASRGASPAERMRSASTSAFRKFSWTNCPSVAANWSLRSTMIAVCGIGRPSGWRKRAVTANQSATPPTMAASAPACT